MQGQAISTTGAYRPRIGVTNGHDPSTENYCEALQTCKGDAIRLSNDLGTLEFVLADLDGLLVTGGSDIEPTRYGAEVHAKSEPSDPMRDAFELAIIRRAFELGIPTLAVCRGMQIANVAWGGTLHQHIPDLVDGGVIHDDPSRKFEAFDEHMVGVEPDSLLAGLTRSTRFATNASHHQSVDRLGTGLRVVARTDDGIVEALENPRASQFWLGTQWHPERLLEADEGRSRRIFDAFIQAATKAAAAA